MAIQKIAMTFTTAPTGAALPTGIYDVNFQSKVNAILAFYFANTTDTNNFIPKLDVMVSEINANADEMNTIKNDTQSLHDAVASSLSNTVVSGGWDATTDFKDKSVSYNGYWYHSITAGSNVGHTPAGTDAFWVQGMRAVDTYIASDISVVADAIKVNNAVIIQSAKYQAIQAHDANTLCFIYL